MSAATFTQMVRQLSDLLPRPTFTPEQVPDIDAGRAMLRAIAAEIRSLPHGSEPDLLMAAALVAGRGRTEVLHGFYRELQVLLARTEP